MTAGNQNPIDPQIRTTARGSCVNGGQSGRSLYSIVWNHVFFTVPEEILSRRMRHIGDEQIGIAMNAVSAQSFGLPREVQRAN